MKFPSKKIAIQIPEPCQENWNEMSQAEQGRFCSLCQKKVMDFSQMTDNEIVKYFKNHSEQKTCGHFKTTQVNRPIKVPNRLEEWYWQVEMKYKEGFLKKTYLFLLSGMLLLVGCDNPERELAYREKILETQMDTLKNDIKLEKKQQKLEEIKQKKALELAKIEAEQARLEAETREALVKIELKQEVSDYKFKTINEVRVFESIDIKELTSEAILTGFTVILKEPNPLSFLDKELNNSKKEVLKQKTKNKSNSLWTWLMDKLR